MWIVSRAAFVSLAVRWEGRLSLSSLPAEFTSEHCLSSYLRRSVLVGRLDGIVCLFVCLLVGLFVCLFMRGIAPRHSATFEGPADIAFHQMME